MMVIKHSIRRGETDSKFSVNDRKGFDIELRRTERKLQYNNITDSIDLNKVYESERDASTKYRIILTINPYCSNVLFNPFTEVVEETTKGGNITYRNLWCGNDANIRVTDNFMVSGDSPLRLQYIANTSYKGKQVTGTVINPGYDIFDNHILRATESKVVNPEKGGRVSGVFNTMSDYYRSQRGVIVSEYFRNRGLSDVPQLMNKHLYSGDELLTFEECVADKLIEKNGWFGLNNTASLETVIISGKNKKENINKLISSKNGGEFIDMYPGREQFTFSPVYNSRYNRIEYNWDIVLAYPSENNYDLDLICGKFEKSGGGQTKYNGLLVLSALRQEDINTNKVIRFETYTRHNLNEGDKFLLFMEVKNGDEGTYFTNFSNVFTVKELDNDDSEYVFTISASDFPTYVNVKYPGNGMDEFLYVEGGEWIGESYHNIFEDYANGLITFRIRKIVNGIPCVYYERKMRKLNFTDKNETDSVESIEEKYRLAFASTVYGDDCTQVTFKESIDIDGLKDNLGRPLTDIYVSFLKKNVGSETMYDDKATTITSDKFKKVENSYCFTNMSYGYIFSELPNYGEVEKRAAYSDIHCITSKTNVFDYEGDGLWCGDIVEFSPSSFTETVIADAGFRFNTYQRDNISKDVKFTYHEIFHDDYSMSEQGFKLREVTGECKPYTEGYYYKAYYPIHIKENTLIRQGSHIEMDLYSIRPIQVDRKIMIRVVTNTRYSIPDGNIVYFFDDDEGFMFEFRVISSEGRRWFNLMPVDGWGELYNRNKDKYVYAGQLSWSGITQMVNDGKMVLRIKNNDIPDYAVSVGKNTYLWRDIDLIGSVNSDSDEELVFTNGSFYLTPQVNFYLRRQDPNGAFYMQNEELFPTDVPGNYSGYYTENKFITEEEMKC